MLGGLDGVCFESCSSSGSDLGMSLASPDDGTKRFATMSDARSSARHFGTSLLLRVYQDNYCLKRRAPQPSTLIL